jgi:hypothetical protein
MKKLFFLLLIGIFTSCTNIGIKQIDRREATEITLIKEFVKADSTYKAQINDVNKKDFFEKTKVQLTAFIVNKLKNKASNWEASIYSISSGMDGINVVFLISKQADFEGQTYDHYDSIIFESEEINDPHLKEVFKTLQPKDKVLITGTFGKEKDVQNNIQLQTINNVTIDDEDALRNPSFYFTLTDIKKNETQTLKNVN